MTPGVTTIVCDNAGLDLNKGKCFLKLSQFNEAVGIFSHQNTAGKVDVKTHLNGSKHYFAAQPQWLEGFTEAFWFFWLPRKKSAAETIRLKANE